MSETTKTSGARTAAVAEDLVRLRGLIAIDDQQGHAAQPVREVYTGQEIASVPIGTAEDVRVAFERARKAQAQWMNRPFAERAAILERFRGLVFDNRDRILDLTQVETGKARASAQEDLLDLAFTARYYAKHGPGLLAARRVQGGVPGLTAVTVQYQPKGVVGIIAPWNYPMALSISDAIPALLAGNGVVIKPDSLTPFSTLAGADLLYRAGVPKDLLAVIPGPGSVVGTAIVEDCDFLMFTGSTATGRLLAEQCGRRLIGFSAELGGKNPMIVANGAKIDVAARAATRACFANAGQLCISIERIYVEDAVADEFIDKFTRNVRQMNLAATYDFTADMGSLISEAQLRTVDSHVRDAVDKGAVVLAGGRARPDIGPYFYEPTVLTAVTGEMDCAARETFGPVVSIYRVASVDEAIARANDSEYGLNASVWAGSARAGRAIAARLRTGSVNLDEGYGPSYSASAAPMGGMGASGLGRRHGPDGLLKYAESQTVAQMRLPVIDPPFGITNSLWQQAVTPVARLVQALPWR
ncbi:succinic semialdehyde dehydrogenase [Nocardia sp. NPDC052001]|uniref:succinic semialdehyde dehydrogenase n=1 Tax=Nocardia sp. NPDC052001 TaxID=3154853 RepID=UPI003439CCEF